MELGYLNARAIAPRPPVVSLRWKNSDKETILLIGDKIGFARADVDVDAYRCPICRIITFAYTGKEKGFSALEGKNEFNF